MGQRKETAPKRAQGLPIMKKFTSKFSRLTAMLLVIMLTLSITVPAYAAETASNITARLSPDVTVNYNGEAQNMADVNGNPVYPVSYNGTTYLPIRAVSNMLGVAVDWDQSTQTVLLSDTDSPADYAKADPNAAKPAAANITVRLSPDVTVKYNNTVRTMADVNGNTVYPVSYNGTTYLPIRAVSNMLGVEVDWDQSTQTVLLNDAVSTIVAGEDFTLFTPAGTITINTGDKEGAYKLLADAGISEGEADAILAQVEFINSDTLHGFLTSSDAKVLGTNHIGYDYAEIDWSTANDGYVRIKINEYVTEQMLITVEDNSDNFSGGPWYLFEDKPLTNDGWVNIPLTAGGTEFGVSIYPNWAEDDNDRTYYEQPLKARFTAEFDESVLLLMSHIKVDYENAPLTTAKALELTKNCKTDAEKITAIFNYVSSTIKYDYALVAEEDAKEAAGETNVGSDRDLILDHILTNKTGVCQHYAVLMAGMLRSLGIPCKVVSGSLRTSNGETGAHAWVSVSPDVTGLNKTALGAGTDADGWIRLDPTNTHAKSTTSNDANYFATGWY